MKIATYNVNGIRARLPLLLRWLKEQSPDVVCLQELKAPQEQFPLAALQEAGYGAVWLGQKSWDGVAILAKGCDPVERRRALAGDPDMTCKAGTSKRKCAASSSDAFAFTCPSANLRPLHARC